jgi:competence protein ComGC
MAQIINLKSVRKQKARADKEAQAAQNRVLFGRTKAEKLKHAGEKSLADKHIDGHKKDEQEPQ